MSPASERSPIFISFDVTKSFAKQFKAALKEYGVTAYALAKEAKTNQSQISRWFNSSMEPQARTQQRLVKALVRIIERRQGEANKQ